MKLIELKCPNCGSILQVDSSQKEAYCQFCGTKLAIDDEVQHFQYDNAEQAGYEFEKGRQRAQAEQQYQYNTIPQQSYQQTYAQPPKKKRTWLWVLGWIFFFPIPLTVLLARSQKLDKKTKIILICFIWVMVIIVGAIGNSGSDVDTNEQSNTTQQEEVADDETSSATVATTSAEKIEMNSLQTLFTTLNESTTKDDIDKSIEKNGFVTHEFSFDSGYYIGYESSAVRQRGRDREGEALDVNFVTSGDIEKVGTVSSAEYGINTGSSSHYYLKYEKGKFYYDGKECASGEEAMQLYLANNPDAQKQLSATDKYTDEFVDSINKNLKTKLVFVESFEVQDNKSPHYQHEFRLNAYDEAVGKSYSYNNSIVDIIAIPNAYTTGCSFRIYTRKTKLAECNEIIGASAQLFDPELTNEDVKDIRNYMSENKTANGYYKGKVGILLLGNQKTDEYEMMIKRG